MKIFKLCIPSNANVILLGLNSSEDKKKNIFLQVFFPLSVRGTKALAKGHTQYISDPNGMIDVATTAPKENPQAKGKIIDPFELTYRT